ncbi:hypothetical protein IAU60_002421 [Kwoniella sp. DSM 27419]
MARFTSIGMGKKKFVSSAAEEARADQTAQPDAGPSSEPAGVAAAPSAGNDAPPKAKKKRRGRERTRDETGKRIAIGEKKGPDAKKSSGGWSRDDKIARRAQLTAKHAEERRQKRNEQKNANVTCFACRGVGHASKDCPNILLAASGGGEESVTEGSLPVKGLKRKSGKAGKELTGGKCYRCDGTGHSIHDCPEPLDPSNPTPFATCYICLGTGHLASLCPSNGGKGIYVNGGNCKVCGSVAHRAKDCPDDKRGVKDEGEDDPPRRRKGEIVLGTGGGAGADEDDFMVEARQGMGQKQDGKKKKHAPARNSERPMKRLREVDPVSGELGARLAGGFHPASEPVPTPSEEKVPLTARKPVTQASGSKPKAKVVAF